MARSNWKGPHINHNLITKLKVSNLNNNEILIKNRNSEILPIFVGKIFAIHTGNSYTNLLVTNEMVGHKFGEFAFTRKRYFYKKNK